MMVRCAECGNTQDGDYIEHDEVNGELVCEYCLAEMESDECEPLDTLK